MILATPSQKSPCFQEKIQFEVLRRLHQTPDVSQRILAKELGISLGSLNFCLQALVKKGLVKMHNFSQSKNKLKYAYFLTPVGVAEKSKLTAVFLRWKLLEYQILQDQIKALKAEINSGSGGSQ